MAGKRKKKNRARAPSAEAARLRKKRVRLKRKLLWKVGVGQARFTSFRLISEFGLQRRLKKIFGRHVFPYKELDRLSDELVYKRMALKPTTLEEAQDARKLLDALEAVGKVYLRQIDYRNRLLETFKEFEGISAKLGLKVSKPMLKLKSGNVGVLKEDLETAKTIQENIDRLEALLAKQN